VRRTGTLDGSSSLENAPPRSADAIAANIFVVVHDKIFEQKEDMARLQDKERELQDAIVALQKDVQVRGPRCRRRGAPPLSPCVRALQGHKKEIRDREETVVDKEAASYHLRKKNQELEKFKFVLNYKIQELKRQILPRKREIQDMREQMKVRCAAPQHDQA